MASRCANCGGILEYDIALGKVKCQHCDSIFEADDYAADTSAEEYQDLEDYETTMFVCPSCGAEISATQFDVVDYCMYCGSFVSLESQLTRVKRPTEIIPFSKTKEDCKKLYSSFIRRKIYAPKEFRDDKFIDGFKGIYIPFWNFHYDCGPKIYVRGEKELDRDGDYINVQHYKTKCKINGAIDNLVYDASSSFDDEISLRIAPYKRDKLKPFNISYMFGFYGDIADISKEIYREESDSEVKDKLWNLVTKNKEVAKGHPLEEQPKKMDAEFNIKLKASLAMLPVWFLTWRKGDRVAYSVVNGDTGELYSEVPVDVGRYLLFSILTAIPIYFLLNTSVTFSASQMLVLSMCLAFFMVMLYVFELDKIVRRVMHTDDRGFLETHEEAKKASDEKVSSNFLGDLCEGLWVFIKETGWLSLIFIVCLIAEPEIPIIAMLIMVIGTPVYTIYRLRSNAKVLNDATVWLDVAGALGAIILSSLLLFCDLAPDYPYYCMAILCMAGVGFAAIRMLSRYNQLITRPLPRFFSSKGGKQNA